jgi:hypothetical protein
MTATYIALATITLTSTDSEIVFSSIPDTYRDLVLVNNHLVSTPANQIVTVNSDAGTNYSWVYMGGNGSSAVSGSNSSSNSLLAEALAASNPSDRLLTTLQFMDYAQTNKQKTVLVRSGRAGQGVDAIANRWANTAAINTISIVLNNSASFLTGSTFSLYGIN